MAQPAPTAPVDPATETPDARAARIAWERARLAEAEQDIAAGRYIEGDEAEAWLERELAEAQAAFEREPE
jgi:predicted transcriptional regulator